MHPGPPCSTTSGSGRLPSPSALVVAPARAPRLVAVSGGGEPTILYHVWWVSSLPAKVVVKSTVPSVLTVLAGRRSMKTTISTRRPKIADQGPSGRRNAADSAAEKRELTVTLAWSCGGLTGPG